MGKKGIILALLLLALGPVGAQEFIGCRTDNGWAETPMLRKTFNIAADDFEKLDWDSLNFYVDVTSFGYHELYINGSKVGDHVLQPAVSQLNKRAYMITYDITPLVHEGSNEIMLWLGQGWGHIYGTPAVTKVEVYRELSSWCQAIVDKYTITDSTWEASPSGYSYTGNWQPLQFGGERYDARVKPEWRPASLYDAKDIDVSRQEFKGNRIVDTVAPVSWTSYFKSFR